MRQAKLAEFLAHGEVGAEGGLNGLEERFNELIARLRGLGGHAYLTFVSRALDGAVYAPLPESFEELRREVERELECGYGLVGVSVFAPYDAWFDSELRPTLGKPEEVAIAERREAGCAIDCISTSVGGLPSPL